MATIGLDRLYYAKITENDAGEETYGTPSQLAKAISADLSVELAEATLYADDGASEIVKEFKSGTLSLGIDDIGSTAASDLTGATIDKNKVLISASEDGGDYNCGLALFFIHLHHRLSGRGHLLPYPLLPS